jgi:hypothetical protein
MQDRRRFSRFAFKTGGVLKYAGGKTAVEVLDLSLKGVLVEPQGDWQPLSGGDYQLLLELSPEALVTMDLTLAHWNGARAGLYCYRIDLDSLTHLRRLAEFNLADVELLQRELAELAGG